MSLNPQLIDQETSLYLVNGLLNITTKMEHIELIYKRLKKECSLPAIFYGGKSTSQ